MLLSRILIHFLLTLLILPCSSRRLYRANGFHDAKNAPSDSFQHTTGRRLRQSSFAVSADARVDSGGTTRREAELYRTRWRERRHTDLLGGVERTDEGAHELRSRIARLRFELDRKVREAKDLVRERDYLKKANELIKGQKEAQDSVARLSQAELDEKAREIEEFRATIQKTTASFNDLARKQTEMEENLSRMHREATELVQAKDEMLSRLNHLDMDDLIEARTRGLPRSMAGVVKKSAEIMVPFFDTLSLAADTNHRLVQHVSSEIDKYTHVNIAKSPFMSGILFYCVVLIPVLTVTCFVRRIFDTSIKLSVSHFVIFGNLYFLGMCLVCFVSTIVKGADPLVLFHKSHQRGFIAFNLFLGLYYVWHTAVLSAQTLMSFESRNISQLVATMCVGFHYFIFTWRRVFLDSVPMMLSHSYLVYATIFSFIIYERCVRLNIKIVCNKDLLLWLQGKQELKLSQLLVFMKSYFLTMIRNYISQTTNRSRYSRSSDRKLRSRKKRDSRTAWRVGTQYDYDSCSDAEAGRDDDDDIRQVRPRRMRPVHPTRRVGFLRGFFGANEDRDSSSEDSQVGVWGIFSSSNPASHRNRRRESSKARKIARASKLKWSW